MFCSMAMRRGACDFFVIYFLVNLNSTTHDPQFSNAGGYSCTAGRQGRKDVRGGVVQENADALLDRDERGERDRKLWRV